MSSCADPSDQPIGETLKRWLELAVAEEASDLHLVVGYPPTVRRHGVLTALDGPPLARDDIELATGSLLTTNRGGGPMIRCDRDLSLDAELSAGRTRFRVNLFRAGGEPGACFRLVPSRIPSIQWAGFPETLVRRISGFRDGLVVVTGPTGSGKTTTLAMIVSEINQHGGARIITVEDPVEYHYPVCPGSVVTQRAVGEDVDSFADGLKYGLRQDPDVILVGEIRDQETAQMALSAAETGHLVLTTLHSRDSKGAISRIADLFPQDVQRDIRTQLALSLRIVISQQLLPDVVPGAKRHLALEILWNTSPIASAIRSGKLESIDNYLMMGRDEGMLSFDESLRRLLDTGLISYETALHHVRDPELLRR